jgi:hypothetical protein
MDDELAAKIFAIALHHTLQENEGVVVHVDNEPYLVSRTWDNGEWEVGISPDDSELDNGQKVWIHDGPVGNA